VRRRTEVIRWLKVFLGAGSLLGARRARHPEPRLRDADGARARRQARHPGRSPAGAGRSRAQQPEARPEHHRRPVQFARAGARPPPGASTDVRTVIEDVTAGVQPVAERAGIELRVEDLPRCGAACSVGVLTSVVLKPRAQCGEVHGRGGNAPCHRPRRRARSVRPRGGRGHRPGHPERCPRPHLPYVRGTTHGKEGLGLGLATVKNLCEAHGGRVGVRLLSVRGLSSGSSCRSRLRRPAWRDEGVTLRGAGAAPFRAAHRGQPSRRALRPRALRRRMALRAVSRGQPRPSAQRRPSSR
jgi:hypothetical protein